jgi:hypothetical protein
MQNFELWISFCGWQKVESQFPNTQTNITIPTTTTYENALLLRASKNKPNSNPITESGVAFWLFGGGSGIGELVAVQSGCWGLMMTSGRPVVETG